MPVESGVHAGALRLGLVPKLRLVLLMDATRLMESLPHISVTLLGST